MATNFSDLVQDIGKTAYSGRFPFPSRLPPFVNSVADLDKRKGANSLRELWLQVPARYFENDVNRPIDYDLTDDVLIAYSKQFEKLGKAIQEHIEGFRTFHQLAWEKKAMHHQLNAQPAPRPKPPEESYFAVQWTAVTICRGPVENACGCGCG